MVVELKLLVEWNYSLSETTRYPRVICQWEMFLGSVGKSENLSATTNICVLYLSWVVNRKLFQREKYET